MKLECETGRLRQLRIAHCRHGHRGGFTMVEMVVSAVLLITIMSFVTSLCFRIDLVWKDIAHHRVAVGELSNQLEEITRMSTAQARAALVSMTPSAICEQTLSSPVIVGELLEDELGNRVVLQINWERRHPGKPVELAAWLAPPVGDQAEVNDDQ